MSRVSNPLSCCVFCSCTYLTSAHFDATLSLYNIASTASTLQLAFCPSQSSSEVNKEEWVRTVKKILQSLEALARGDSFLH